MHATPTYSILILGAGAIGSVVGGFLARQGHRVALVGRAAHMEAIARKGLSIRGIWGAHEVYGLRIATDTAPFRGEHFDAIVVSVKSYATQEAAALLPPLLAPDTLVLAYQNGLGNAEQLAAVAGWERTVGVRAIYGARIPAPAEVEVTVIAQPTALGLFRPGPHAARVQALALAMDAAGLPTVFTKDITPVLWAKVAYNCALNPLSALLDVPYGRLAELPETRAIMAQVIEELYAEGAHLGVQLQPASPAAYLELFYEQLVPPTAVHYASMREDLRQGRRTEIEALNGAIARFGSDYKQLCPANTLLTRLIHAREHCV